MYSVISELKSLSLFFLSFNIKLKVLKMAREVLHYIEQLLFQHNPPITTTLFTTLYPHWPFLCSWNVPCPFSLQGLRLCSLLTLAHKYTIHSLTVNSLLILLGLTLISIYFPIGYSWRAFVPHPLSHSPSLVHSSLHTFIVSYILYS